MLAKTKESSKLYVKWFLVNLIVFTVVFAAFILPTFNSDTIYHCLNPYGDMQSFVTSGRYLTALLNWIFCKIHYNTAIQTGVTFGISAILYALGLLICQKAFYEMEEVSFRGKEESVLLVILLLPLINVFMLEPMMFIELEIVYALAFLTAVLMFVSLSKRQYIWAFVFAASSVMLYQSHIVMGFILYSGYLFLKNHGRLSGKVVLDEIVSGCIVLLAGAANIISVRILKYCGIIQYVPKSISMKGGLEKIKMLGQVFWEIITDNYGLLPCGWFLPALLGLVIALVCRQLLKSRRYLDVFYYVGLCCGMLLVPCLFGLIQPTAAIPPRIAFSAYTGIAMILLTAYSFWESLGKHMCTAGVVILLVLEAVMCNIISTEHRASNALDKAYIEMVYSEIEKYEVETGIAVEYIEVLYDTECMDKWEQIKYSTFCINRRAIIDGWCDVWFLNYYAGREFIKTHENEEIIYQQYVEGRNWDTFAADEQLIFDNNYLYWIIY